MAEIRRFERVPFMCRLELATMPGGKPQPAHAVDLSVEGVGAMTQSGFPVGQLTTVTFYFNDRAHGLVKDQAMGRVVHFNANADSNHVGIEFLQPLTESEHPRLVGKLADV